MLWHAADRRVLSFLYCILHLRVPWCYLFYKGKARLSHRGFREHREMSNYGCIFFSLLLAFICLGNADILFFFCMIGYFWLPNSYPPQAEDCTDQWKRAVPATSSFTGAVGNYTGWNPSPSNCVCWLVGAVGGVWASTESQQRQIDRRRKMHHWSLQNNIWEAVT